MIASICKESIFFILILCIIQSSKSSVPKNRDISPHYEARTSHDSKLTNLHIGGLFPVSGTGGWQGGQGCLPAARMALNDVNNEAYMLPGYKLVLHWNDSQVSLFSSIYNVVFLIIECHCTV